MSDLDSIPERCLPVWVRERRAPTRAELAAKHDADTGQGSPAPGPRLEFFDDTTPAMGRSFGK